MEHLVIVQGVSFLKSIRWGTSPLIYTPIVGVTGLAPLQLQVPGHSLLPGWRAEVCSVVGMVEVNSSGEGLPEDYHNVTIVDADHVELNDVNALGFGEYVSGGVLKYYTPVDLTGKKVRFKVWDKLSGQVYIEGSNDDSKVLIDPATCTISLLLSDEDTSALPVFSRGEFAVDAEDILTGLVTRISSGTASVDASEYLVVTP